MKEQKTKKTEKTKINKKTKAEEQVNFAEKMANRLAKIDDFVAKLVEEEKETNITSQEIIELLMIKARHYAFMHCPDNEPSKVLVWLIEMVLFNANELFALTKEHLKQK